MPRIGESGRRALASVVRRGLPQSVCSTRRQTLHVTAQALRLRTARPSRTPNPGGPTTLSLEAVTPDFQELLGQTAAAGAEHPLAHRVTHGRLRAQRPCPCALGPGHSPSNPSRRPGLSFSSAVPSAHSPRMLLPARQAPWPSQSVTVVQHLTPAGHPGGRRKEKCSQAATLTADDDTEFCFKMRSGKRLSKEVTHDPRMSELSLPA